MKAIGSEDNNVRMLSLDPDSRMEQLGMQVVQSIPDCITITDMDVGEGQRTYFVHVGLQNGILVRLTLDNVVGTLSDTRMRFIGSRPVRLFQVCVGGSLEKNAVLVFSTKPWLVFMNQGISKLVPLL